MNSWISKVVASTAEAESPERFQYWSAMAAIAAVVKKNVYIDRYYYKLYPNIYVFLIAKSGLRKSNPVTLAKKLVQEANCTRVILGRNSIQAVLKELGRSYSVEGGGMIKEAAGFLVSGELASFLVKDPEALTILTDLYDTFANEPEWKNTLKTAGTDILKNPCLTLLGATNEEHFKAAVPNDAIGGGFIARTLIVFESHRRILNDLMDAPRITPSIEKLSEHLKTLSKLTGEFKIMPEAKALYRAWYKEFSSMPHDDKTGTIERMGDTVLKIAMILSLSNSISLELNRKDIEGAIYQCTDCLDGLQQVTMGGNGKSDLKDQTALILKELLKRDNHQIKRSALLSKFWGEMDSYVLDRVIETINQSGAIEIDRIGKDVLYTMKKSAVELYSKFKREVN